MNTVTVTNIDIKFWTLVWLIVKVAFAAIPALFAIIALSTIFWGVLLGLFSVLAGVLAPSGVR